VGTKFVVYRHTDDTTTVTVLAGRVSVGSMAGTQNLQAGQTVTVGGRNRAIHAVSLSPPEIARRLSWRAGVLSFQGETLAEAIAEINRYNKRRLVIEDPVIADWQLGGMFQARDLDAFIATLEHAFSLRAERTPNGARVIVLRRR